jgi:hypothetical protein
MSLTSISMRLPPTWVTVFGLSPVLDLFSIDVTSLQQEVAYCAEPWQHDDVQEWKHILYELRVVLFKLPREKLETGNVP